MFSKTYAVVFEGDEQWQKPGGAAGRDLRLGRRVDLHQAPALLRGHDPRAGAGRRHQGRARAGGAGRQHHHRPHLAGGQHQEGRPGRQVPDQPRRRSRRTSTRYGARRGNHEVMVRGTFANIRLKNLLAPGTEGGVTRHLPDGAADVDLRRRREVRRRGRAAGRAGGQGIRQRLVARLGGQGDAPAGRARRHRRELRAHPPHQPGRHGRRAAGVPAGRERRHRWA